MKLTLKSDCIEWDKCRNKKGYGRIRHNGKMWGAHRLAWTQEHGPIPKGICVLHRCDNPPCVNVQHLFLGTKKDNTQDMLNKGRGDEFKKGEANPNWKGRGAGFKKGEKSNAKLTSNDVLEIRKLIALGVVQRRVAERFCVHQTAISHIKKSRTWKEE